MVKESVPHLHIFHVPQGIEDPYTQQPWERTPREPHTGEEVAVHVVTQPQGAAAALFVHLSVKGGESWTVPASPSPWDGEGNRWVASLGAFPEGACVSYGVQAHSTTRQRVVERPYCVDVSVWHPLKAVTMWQATGTRVLMRMADTSGGVALVSLEVLDVGERYVRVWPHAPATVAGMANSVPYANRQGGDD